MTKKISLLILIVCQFAWAQPRKMSFDKMIALKSDYLTEKMELNDSESAIFKKVYSEQERKIHEFRVENIRANKKQFQSYPESITESMAEIHIQEIQTHKRTILAMEEEKTASLLQYFSSKQIVSMMIHEERFRKELIRRIRDKKRENNHKD